MPKFITAFFKDQRGFSLFMVGMGIMALFGMASLVTDFGRIALSRQRLVNAVDSAALAAARDLTLIPDPYTREMVARQRAVDIASANGAPPTGVTVNITNNRISVEAVETVDLIMSRAFGVSRRTVSARAAAQVGSINTYTGIAPLTIKEQPLATGQMVTLKYGSPTSPGNFGALSLGGRGADKYRENLIYGYPQKIKIGDSLETKPGNMSGPTGGIDQRLARCTDGCTFDSFKPNCPRIIVIPTHREGNLRGRDEIKVTGFAAFFVDRKATGSADDEIKGYFLRIAAEGDPNLLQPVISLYGTKLVE